LTPLDLTPLRRDGFQLVEAAFDASLLHEGGDDGARSAAGAAPLLELARAVLGVDAQVFGARRLGHDDLHGPGAAPRQDEAYLPPGGPYMGMLALLTPVGGPAGGPGFFPGSHRFGRLSRGPLDPSRLPRTVPQAVVAGAGDVVLFDPRVWRFGAAPTGAAAPDALLVAYEAASEACVGGTDRLFRTRFDASGVPSSELSVSQARSRLAQGDYDGAARFARGLITDDLDHAAAALALHDALASLGDPEAETALRRAETAVTRLAAQTLVRLARRGRGAAVAWRPLETVWRSLGQGAAVIDRLPGVLETPAQPWAYGAITDLISLPRAAALRLTVRALRGRVGFCVVSEDQTRLLSDQTSVTPDDGAAAVFLAFDPEAGPARLCARNFADPGVEGRVELLAVESVAPVDL
jgi:hypothetical protein